MVVGNDKPDIVSNNPNVGIIKEYKAKPSVLIVLVMIILVINPIIFINIPTTIICERLLIIFLEIVSSP